MKLSPLRLVVFDATDTRPVAVPRVERGTDGTARGTGGLTRFWKAGALIHRVVRYASATHGVTTWKEAFEWAVRESQVRGAPIAELQAWGHGGWGYMGMGSTRLDAEALKSAELAPSIDALSKAMDRSGLVWLRCCSAFGGEGREFAPRLAERLGVRVAGHTFIIGVLQSGTHSLMPDERAGWSTAEGIERDPRSGLNCARLSSPGAPNTLSCFRLGLPRGW
jgi:hypothetical protein